jgi:gliding motility-associated protein GldE
LFNQLITELEEDPYYQAISMVPDVTVYPFTINLIFAIIAILILLLLSALVSGAEAAFFSLTPGELDRIQNSKSTKDQTINRLLGIPEKLLATILVSNNLLNIGIIVISAYVSSSLFDFTNAELLGFIIEVVIITLVIVFFGEILPKIYAIRYAGKFAGLMARPLEMAERFFRPLNFLLVHTASWIQHKFTSQRKNISMDDLSEALDLTKHGISEDKRILEGIVKFGNINASEVMTPRIDIVGVPMNTRFRKLIGLIVESGYSRIPVYKPDLDNIKGILYIKDLLPYLDKPDSFNWQSLMRPAYYIPEAKKISDLLKEFQTSKIHMAVVIDEYGGTLGIITLEDILEEIVGEITDESDNEELPPYVKVDEQNYLFEGKVLLNDFFKVFNLEEDEFDNIKGEADTLAGLILELKGEMPRKNETFNCGGFLFTVKSVDQRRIKQVQVTVNENDNRRNDIA